MIFYQQIHVGQIVWCIVVYCCPLLLSENGDTMDLEDAINFDSTRKTGKFLWSEKYSPKHFTELLSDDVS